MTHLVPDFADQKEANWRRVGQVGGITQLQEWEQAKSLSAGRT